VFLSRNLKENIF